MNTEIPPYARNELTAGFSAFFADAPHDLLFLFVPHRHDNVQEAIAAFDRDRAHDVVHLDEHVVHLDVLERIQEEVRVERSGHLLAVVLDGHAFAAFADVAVRFEEHAVGLEREGDFRRTAFREGHADEFERINNAFAGNGHGLLEGSRDDLTVIRIVAFDELGGNHGGADYEHNLVFGDIDRDFAFLFEEAFQFIRRLLGDDDVAFGTFGKLIEHLFAESETFAVGRDRGEFAVANGEQDTLQDLAGNDDFVIISRLSSSVIGPI